MSDNPRTAVTVMAAVRACFNRLGTVDQKIRGFAERPHLLVDQKTLQAESMALRAEADAALRQAILACLDAHLYSLEAMAAFEREANRPRMAAMPGGRSN